MKVGSVITASVCVFFILLVLLALMNHISKTSAKEPFQFPTNRLFETDFDNTSLNCLQMAQKKNIPGIDSLTESQRLVLSKLDNNVYQDGEREDGSVFYGTDECIIPQNVANEFGVQNCLVGNLQLETDNPIIQNVAWHNYRGCVINSNMFATKIVDIANTLAKMDTEGIRRSQQAIIDQTTNTYNQANQLNISRSNAYQAASSTGVMTKTATENAESLLTKSYINESNSRRNEDLARSYNVIAQDAVEFEKFISDKIVGIRWYAYNEYFSDSQTYLNNIWDGKAVPFDAGVTKTINGFEGITGKLSSYTIDNFTQDFTLLFEFVFRPDVGGEWEFRTTSDDASYFWISPWKQDDGNGAMFFSGSNPLSILTTVVNNKGKHGMTTKSAYYKVDAGNMYKCYVVHGNWGNSSTNTRSNPTDIRFEVRRPNNTWFTLRSGDAGPGAADSEKWTSRYMVYDTFKKGMIAKVYSGYFADNTTWVRQNKPLAAVRLRSAINSDSIWPAGHGLVIKGAFRRQNPELIRTWNHGQANPGSTHLYDNEPTDNVQTPDLRTITFAGFFQSVRAGNYTFFFEGDDAIYMWVGESAKEFTSTNLRSAFDATDGAANAVNKLPGAHGPISQPYVIYMESNKLYLIRVMQGNAGGWNYLRFGYREPHGLIRWDLTSAFRF